MRAVLAFEDRSEIAAVAADGGFDFHFGAPGTDAVIQALSNS
jgi:hypothetical protein